MHLHFEEIKGAREKSTLPPGREGQKDHSLGEEGVAGPASKPPGAVAGVHALVIEEVCALCSGSDWCPPSGLS